MRPAAALDSSDIGRLLPMHLSFDVEGRISGCGPTLAKLIGGAPTLDTAFELHRPACRGSDAAAALRRAALRGERVFLRLLRPPHTILRGHGMIAHSGHTLFDLGFGIGLHEAVRQFNLTDADFSPADLAMEMLFLHEANAAVLGALSEYNAQLDAQRQAAESRAFTDSLTGLANRRGLSAALAAATRGARVGSVRGERRAEDRAGFALLHLDLDGFKAVNDTHGHAAGDKVLQQVADILRAVTRVGDAVARPGGDEFVLVLPGLVARDGLEALTRRIIARIEAPIVLPQAEVRISVSIGIAVSGDYPPDRLGEMSDDADDALYAAKRGGRGRGCLATGPGGAMVMIPSEAEPSWDTPAAMAPARPAPCAGGVEAPMAQAWPVQGAGSVEAPIAPARSVPGADAKAAERGAASAADRSEAAGARPGVASAMPEFSGGRASPASVVVLPLPNRATDQPPSHAEPPPAEAETTDAAALPRQAGSSESPPPDED